MRINHNIPALVANNQLKKTNNALDKSLEKLSSGYRINRAADDAAGMAISQKMKTQIAALDQASRNASDGISVIQTAEGALSEVEAMLQRVRELAVQASNGTYTNEDRTSIQSEVAELNKEINRISTDTEFNSKPLLNGNLDRQVYTNNTKVKVISLSDEVKAQDYKIKITSEGLQANVTGATLGTLGATFTSAEAGTININGEEVKIESGDTLAEGMKKIRDLADLNNIDLTTNPASAGLMNPSGAKLVFNTREYGSDQSISISSNNPALLSMLGLPSAGVSGVTGTDAVVVKDSPTNLSATSTINVKGNNVTITDMDGFKMKLELSTGSSTLASTTISVLDAGSMALQVGANENQTVDVKIPKVDTKTLGIDLINFGTQKGAEKGIELLDAAVAEVSGIRGKLGAYQNRMDHAIANLDESSENMSEALSRIADVDMAEEMANYTQKNVLSQAGTSMLAQANERPKTILTLLQG